MKKLYKILAILAIIILIIISTQIISNAKTATVITETLNLRKKATTDSSILEQISEDEKVEILETGLGDDGKWYKVKYKDMTGYVHGEFLKINGSGTTTNNNENTVNNTVNQNTNTSENNTITNTVKNENVTNTVKNEVVNNVIENNTISNNTVENTISEENTIENNTGETNTIPEQTEITKTEEIKKVEIDTNKTVNEEQSLYIVPLINASKIYNVKAKEKLYVVQVLNGWAYVNGDNASGWIRCSNLIDVE